MLYFLADFKQIPIYVSCVVECCNAVYCTFHQHTYEYEYTHTYTDEYD